MISNYEKQYMDILKRIYEEGYADGVNKRTGVATKRLPGCVIQVDVEEEFPILKSKQVFGKTAQREIEWIWKQQSNNIHDLQAHIWDEWADEDGGIGKAYGYQMAKPVTVFKDPIHKTDESFRSYENQAEYVIEMLREDPSTRWCVATLWNPQELRDMNLVPCCHTSTWNLDGGRLNCVLDQRSGDMPYGVPFNTTQYAILMLMIAKELGVKPGILTHVIADAHIYDRQMKGVELQLMYYDLMREYGMTHSVVELMASEDRLFKWAEENPEYKQDWWKNNPKIVAECVKDAWDSKPYFVIDTDKSFFEYDADSCRIEDYFHMGEIKFGDIVV